MEKPYRWIVVCYRDGLGKLTKPFLAGSTNLMCHRNIFRTRFFARVEAYKKGVDNSCKYIVMDINKVKIEDETGVITMLKK